MIMILDLLSTFSRSAAAPVIPATSSLGTALLLSCDDELQLAGCLAQCADADTGSNAVNQLRPPLSAPAGDARRWKTSHDRVQQYQGYCPRSSLVGGHHRQNGKVSSPLRVSIASPLIMMSSKPIFAVFFPIFGIVSSPSGQKLCLYERGGTSVLLLLFTPDTCCTKTNLSTDTRATVADGIVSSSSSPSLVSPMRHHLLRYPRFLRYLGDRLKCATLATKSTSTSSSL